MPNVHDMFTGSQTDGRAMTDSADRICNNWTSSGAGSAQVGHSERIGNGNTSCTITGMFASSCARKVARGRH